MDCGKLRAQETDGSRILGNAGTPGAIRTPNLLIRSQMLYPIELRVRRAGREG